VVPGNPRKKIGEKMINFKMAFPPGKENLYVPAEFIDHDNLTFRKI